MTEVKQKQLRGFAVLSKERRREIASLGGASAHAQGKAHKFTPEEARLAGIKGGLARTRKLPEGVSLADLDTDEIKLT